MKYILMLAVCLLSMGMPAWAEEEAPKVDEYAYYGFEPEIVTNYISNRKKLGFVRLSVDMMVKNADDLVQVEKHEPLLRAAIIEIVGNQPEDKIKSLTGREEIRRECYEAVNKLMEAEAGKALIVNLLFTKYLYD